MSTKWHGGKGDKNRTNDYKAYTDNYDKIFRKMNEATVTKDLYGCFDEIDLFEEDRVSWYVLPNNGMIEIKVLKEAPGLFGEASARTGLSFVVSPKCFDERYKPYLD